MSRGGDVRARPGRAWGILLLLLSAGLVALAPPAQAQEAPFLCFDREQPDVPVDPLGDPAGVTGAASSCEPGLYEPGNYLEGETVRIRVQNLEGSEPYVRVRCLEGCHEVLGNSYYARHTDEYVDFPRHFNDPGPGADPNGRNAIGDRVPRYNSTWEATLLLGNGAEVKRTFHVWMMTLWRSEEQTLHPGELHKIRVSGFDANSLLTVKIDRRVDDRRETVLLAKDVRTSGRGDHIIDWRVDKAEARNIAQCGERKDDCYQLTVVGVGKRNETLKIPVAPARIVVRALDTTGNDQDRSVPHRMQRTESDRLAFTLNYPGGSAAEGPKLFPDDLVPSSGNPLKGLRIVVERYLRSDPDEPGFFHEEGRIYYVPVRFRWEVDFHAERDLPLEPKDVDQRIHYRVRLVEQPDQYGNLVPGRVLGNFTIDPATLVPTLAVHDAELPRTEAARFVVAVAYHNGSAFGAAENATPMRGCFMRTSQGGERACSQLFGDVFVDGAPTPEGWVFTTRYARDHPYVGDEGSHRFVLIEGTVDHWGNKVAPLTSPVFKVVRGEPDIRFTTVVRGLETETLPRGHSISVQAVITYGDGRPFNHTVQVGENRTIAATLTRRGPNGAIQAQETFELYETDQEAGRWIANLDLPRDDTQAPAGRWTWSFAIADNLTVPNRATAEFDRTVVASVIKLVPDAQPSIEARTGLPVKFRFRLLFEDDKPVDPATLAGRLTAHIHKVDKATGKPVGEPVSGALTPAYNQATGLFSLEYVVPPNLFSGTYVFLVQGGDGFGNALAKEAVSRAFSTHSPTAERSVLVQPAAVVRRGDAAVVQFDGRDGDTGLAGAGAPRLVLERLDAVAGGWVVESGAALKLDESGDHMGVFAVTTTTFIGTYRFRLEGRDAQFTLITATSQNFTVEATLVTRSIVQPPPPSVVKGDPIDLAIERLDGDQVLSTEVLLNGRATNLQRPLLTTSAGRTNLTFAVPFESPAGNYSVRVVGRDLHGNRIEIVSPFVDVLPATLAGRVIANPSRVVERGEDARILFGITNPDGAFYLLPDEPRVSVHNGTAVVAQARVTREGLTFSAVWTPGEAAEETEYRFEVSGTGTGGNAFPTLRSQSFRVAPGTLERAAGAVKTENIRLETITWEVPFKPEDRDVEFTLGYFGAASDAAAAVFERQTPTVTTIVPHSVDAEAGRYVARFVTDHQTAPGAYRLSMKGVDAAGNEISARSNVFLLRTSAILVTWDPFPPSSDFGEGKTITLSFVTKYRSGDLFGEDLGRPSVVLVYTGPDGRQLPVKQRPDVEFRNDRWFVSWTGPEDMPDGSYVFSIGGADGAGNVIAGSTSTQYPLITPVEESFGKLLDIPGPPPALLLLALLGVALLGRRVRRT